MLPWAKPRNAGGPGEKGAQVNVLLVEDDPTIVEALARLLHAEGYRVVACARQSEAIELAGRETFAIALLDVTLAEGSGFGVCAALRAISPDMPVIFLTASDDEYSTVAGLEAGAVDYIAKPFRPRELTSRIRAALRRPAGAASVLRAGDVELDPARATCTKAGVDVVLSAMEYRLLLVLMQAHGRLVTREGLRDAIWDSAGEYVEDNTLNVYVRRLREKIEDDPSSPRVLLTVRGLGYKMADAKERTL